MFVADTDMVAVVAAAFAVVEAAAVARLFTAVVLEAAVPLSRAAVFAQLRSSAAAVRRFMAADLEAAALPSTAALFVQRRSFAAAACVTAASVTAAIA